jgi:hypothetical protein
MIKMYRAEVLGKLPVIQHFLFGRLLPAPDISHLDGGNVTEDEHGHIHGQEEKGWTMDCCGIPGMVSLSWYEALSDLLITILIYSAIGLRSGCCKK